MSEPPQVAPPADVPITAEFVHHLVRGTELLQAGDHEGARQVLEEAIARNPGSERAQNLLALAHFKLGAFAEAESIFSALAARHPEDPSLQVNLGLIHLKTGRAEQAVQSFARAVELAPTHRKAQNYLGLAHLFKGERDLAREWFERAGNRSMCERLSAMGNAPTARMGEDALRLLESREGALPERSTPVPLDDSLPDLTLAPAPVRATSIRDPDIPDLETLAHARALEVPESVPFAVSPFQVVISVGTELLTRLDGLVATSGPLSFSPENKRYRGQTTERSFGEPGRRMMRARGPGRLWISTGGRHFTAVEVISQPAYFREAAVYAFEESLAFENGRVPSKTAGDLHLVHLRGRGRVLVTSAHLMQTLEVVRGQPCRVPMAMLLGWTGSVVPRIVTLAEGGGPDGQPLSAVELTGEGQALLDAPL